MTNEFEEHKQRSRETQANDSREICAQQGKNRDLTTRLDTCENEKRHALEELGQAHSDTAYWQQQAEALQKDKQYN